MENKMPPNRYARHGKDPAGCREQLAEAYDACAAGLFRYALMITADRSTAEDAVQQVFTKLAAGGRGLSEIASRNGYLRSAVRNECYRIARRRIRSGDTDSGSMDMLEAMGGHDTDPEQQQAIEQALRSLPPDQREAVHMKVYENKTFNRIADELGVSINTVASRYRYAIEKLRRLLGPYCLEDCHDD